MFIDRCNMKTTEKNLQQIALKYLHCLLAQGKHSFIAKP